MLLREVGVVIYLWSVITVEHLNCLVVVNAKLDIQRTKTYAKVSGFCILFCKSFVLFCILFCNFYGRTGLLCRSCSTVLLGNLLHFCAKLFVTLIFLIIFFFVWGKNIESSVGKHWIGLCLSFLHILEK